MQHGGKRMIAEDLGDHYYKGRSQLRTKLCNLVINSRRICIVNESYLSTRQETITVHSESSKQDAV